MKESFKRGLSFGVTSGIITTLGLIVGLNSGTGMKLAVIGGILTIAIADAFSDALGIHVSEESLRRNNQKSIWEATIMTFITKFVIAISFVLPFLFFELRKSVVISIFWGFLLLIAINYFVARQRNEKPLKIILEHIVIASIVVLISNYIGEIIAFYFI